MATSFAAIIGGVVGGIILLGVITLLAWFFKFPFRKFSKKDSESGSSDPSAAAEMSRGRGAGPNSSPPVTGPQEARTFRIEELEQATRQFHESNLIGCGSFGVVYKGLLSDGTIVAIKKRNGAPRQEFSEEVAYLSRIQHRNLVTLLGYCQERGTQMLVYEYLPNGSIRSHLHDTGSDTKTKLEFKQRLSIAMGAARGLCHLHSLQLPLVHGNFQTADVLVDETFTAKVADAGLSKLLAKIDDAGSSSGSSSFKPFRDPELGPLDAFHETNDVYSFGIFLLELISGKEVKDNDDFRSNASVLQFVQDCLYMDNLIDSRLAGSFTEEGMRDLVRLMLKCTRFPGAERPTIENVVMDLERILEKEITRTTVVGEGTTTVTLGSQLFTNLR